MKRVSPLYKKLFPIFFVVIVLLVYACQNTLLAKQSLVNHAGTSRFIILADTHLPGANVQEKMELVRTINLWKDKTAIIALGDLVETTGTTEEYDFAKHYFGLFNAPVYYLTGNHDYIYEKANSPMHHGRRRGTPQEKQKKLDMFKSVFKQKDLYFSQLIDNKLLIFASADDLNSPKTVSLSSDQISWLKEILRQNQDVPTIIFFHAPLKGTVRYPDMSENSWAQPSREIDTILRENHQVKLWVSGHTHTCPRNPTYISPLNLYKKRVLNVNNCDLKDGRNFWISEVVLDGDKVHINVFDSKKKIWDPLLSRKIRIEPY